MDSQFYAHSCQRKPPCNTKPCEHWQLLKDHLLGVAELARRFAKEAKPDDKAFQETAYWAGLLHDLGKYKSEFQELLRQERGRDCETHHAACGAAAVAYELNNTAATFAIAGHHAGLHNLADLQQMLLRYDAQQTYPRLWRQFHQEISTVAGICKPLDADLLSADVLTRMLFSILVDADRLDTAALANGEGWKPSVIEADLLLQKLTQHIEQIEKKSSVTLISSLRRKVQDSAKRMATRPQGFFSLTVPTGGGKTLASLLFALGHAIHHHLRRIIVVIPYLSIIEQTASIYRNALGEDAIVEHHSAVAVAEDDEEFEAANRSQLALATENWDAPVIVTTSVRFIETLFARSPAACRRLHNVSRSVVVFDEIQTLPGHLLNPTMSILRDLVRNWGTSMVFCSATQPGFRRTAGFSEGLGHGDITEIVPNPSGLFRNLQRVRYCLPPADERLGWVELADRVVEHRQALIVVNTRKAAFEFWNALRSRLPDEQESILHLSSAMCAEHRLALLGRRDQPIDGSILDRLRRQQPCRVVSTQLIEAGVDIDFPVVYRALGPLDGIIQAAGRCNREGRLPEPGEVHVFIPSKANMPKGPYTTATNHTAALLVRLADPDRLAVDPDLYAEYYQGLYGELLPTDLSAHGEHTIQEDRRQMRFRTVSENARVVDDATTSVIVPYGPAKSIIEEIRLRRCFTRHDLRRLQRFMVNVRGYPGAGARSDFMQLMNMRVINTILPDVELWVLDESSYSDFLGVVIQQRPAEDLIL